MLGAFDSVVISSMRAWRESWPGLWLRLCVVTWRRPRLNCNVDFGFRFVMERRYRGLTLAKYGCRRSWGVSLASEVGPSSEASHWLSVCTAGRRGLCDLRCFLAGMGWLLSFKPSHPPNVALHGPLNVRSPTPWLKVLRKVCK
jgi:hypothetical protein